MARVLFARGARGEIVRRAQKRISERNLLRPEDVDGIYGGDTEEAINRFQRNSGIPATGELDDVTWTLLTDSAVPPASERALQVTAAFEGHGFTKAEGNFDGAGMTWGIVGFTLRYGQISRIVLRVHSEDPDLLRRVFREGTDELLDTMRGDRGSQVAWGDRLSLGKKKSRLAEPWLTRFEKLGTDPLVQRIQLEVARDEYFVPALRTAKKFALNSELGVALAFDIHVQNGGVKKAAEQIVISGLGGAQAADEPTRRKAVANAVADSSSERWRDNVRARKLTLATGSGVVNGMKVVLRNWGLAESPFA